MNFGLSLVKKGHITAEQYVSAAEKQFALRPMVGTVAIEIGKLSMKEVFEILRDQADAPSKMFGEIAVESGLLTEEDLAVILYHQSISVPPISEILVELGIMSPYEVDSLLQEFRQVSRNQIEELLTSEV